MAAPAPGDVDPVIDAPFRIGRDDRIVTAGSCFAQHLGRHLADAGFNHHITERAHALTETADLAEGFNYGVYAARYGNIYTPRQLVQLFDRAYGAFAPEEDVWREADGTLVDPYRPQIQPGGFPTEAEYAADRRQHFAACRRAFEEAGLFVFTLGLTEAWVARSDGAVFPLCPGVAGGAFDPARHAFENFSAADLRDDLRAFVKRLRTVNPQCRVLLTVSPVPLKATASPEHVLVATSYSKAALLVAAHEVAQLESEVAYFPSYEIVTGSFNRGSYFAPDLRAVNEAGVRHVMRCFMRHFAIDGPVAPAAAVEPPTDPLAEIAELVEVNCDEEALVRR
ncbi:MAG: GSCFA domain-containing protein [Bauldia sp.]|nr:GSCFA domain-containing protein [Bauldia sp.]